MAQEIYHRSEWGNPNEQWGNVYLNADLTNELYKRASEYENSWVTDQLLNGVGTKPSIILTPTAYEDGVLNSVKPAKTLGSELVTNGTFDTDTDWIKGGAWSISGGTANYNDSTNASLYQNVTLNANIYELKFSISNSSGSGARIWIGNSSGSVSYTDNTYQYYTDEDYTLTINVPSNQTTFAFWGNTAGSSFSIDNVSVKEVIDADFDFTRGSSATRVNEKGLVQDVQLLSGELVQNGNFEQIGSEQIVNGDFSDSSWWGLDPVWSISNGSANCNGSGVIYKGGVLTIGKTYKVEVEISSYTSGTLTYPNAPYSLPSAVGSYTFYYKANSQTVSFTGTNFIGSIDNVSVKEVGQNWTLGTGWSIGEGKAISDGTQTAYSTIKQIGAAPINTNYKMVFTADITSGSIEPSVGGSNSQGQISASGTYTFYTITSIGDNNLYFGASADFVGSITNISLIEITDDTDLPRINYTNFDYENGVVVPYSGEGSLLLEPQSTNKVTYSEDFSQWAINALTTLDTGYAAPDGSTNAYKVTSTGTGGYVVESGGVSSNDARTIYAKTVSGSGTLQLLSHNTNTNNIFTITEQWQRFELNSTTQIPANFYAVDFRGAASTLTEVIIWGAQSETLSYPTSYIPTNGSTVTRLADVCNNSGSSDLINSTEGVLYAEIASFVQNGLDRAISLSNGTISNAINIFYFSTSNTLRILIISGGSTQVSIDVSVSDITDFQKIAINYANNDVSVYVNGLLRGTDTSVTIPSGLSRLGFDYAGVSPFYGNVKCVAVFKEALSDTELEKLTQV
jgi:hypothetical protein